MKSEQHIYATTHTLLYNSPACWDSLLRLLEGPDAPLPLVPSNEVVSEVAMALNDAARDVIGLQYNDNLADL